MPVARRRPELGTARRGRLLRLPGLAGPRRRDLHVPEGSGMRRGAGKASGRTSGARGLKDATCDAATAAEWWDDAEWNVAIASAPVRRRRARHRPEDGADPASVVPSLGLGGYPVVRTGRRLRHGRSTQTAWRASTARTSTSAARWPRAAPCASPARAQPLWAARRGGPHRTARPRRRRSSPRPEGSPARSADCSAWRDGSPPRRSSGASSSQKVARTGRGSAAHAEKAAHPPFGSGTSRSGGIPARLG